MTSLRSCVIAAFSLALPAATLVVPAGCGGDEATDAFEDEEELAPGGAVGKYDDLEEPGLPVNGNYASTTAWKVVNQWEDTDTPAARAAGIAWPANSGLSWDEKFAAWLQSMPKVETFDGFGETFEIATPWGKTLPAPKLDCADTALMLRSTFAAWYGLPFFVVAFDGKTPVYFGHFGIRTKNGIWNNMPKFANAYADHSAKSAAQVEASWPQDAKLRKLGVQSGDDQPMIGEGARTGTYLDELHLNKRAAHLIRLTMIFTGSVNLADSRNTFNLVPESLRAGDVMLWRTSSSGVGHTMVTVRAEQLGEGRMSAESVFGNLPPAQPRWTNPAGTERNYSDPEGGGVDGSTDYAKFNGGLKRFRVTKSSSGFWVNTIMKSDEAAWIPDDDLDRIRARPAQLDALLGELTPDEHRQLLLDVIEGKRAHLRNFPASCSARIAREDAFEDLYTVLEQEFGMTRDEVDAEHRILEDYVFAELVYEQSKTCCWNSTNDVMFRTIMSLNDELQEQAGDACVEPLPFMAVDGGYQAFRDHDPLGWKDWRADEACPQANVQNDLLAEAAWTPFCEWNAGQ
ncbi:MAG: hypothetical protein IPK74_02165 [Deltaproteobacteria bacterium]|nr:hypothetical protein [Deltaproteobacteria bacterium]